MPAIWPSDTGKKLPPRLASCGENGSWVGAVFVVRSESTKRALFSVVPPLLVLVDLVAKKNA
jgi:hypothetical protein